MLSTMMMIMVMTMLSIMLLGLVLSQAMPTQFAQKNTQTIYAAEAGIETALGRLRNAQGDPDFVQAVYGDIRKLPCALTGSVAAPGGELTYSVKVRYFRENPAGQSEAWLDSSKKLGCTEGHGTTLQPLFAHITSTGRAPTGSTLEATDGVRTMSTIYRFDTTSTNVKGGRIYSYESKFCLRADGTTVGSAISYIAVGSCGDDDDRELWLWDTDYQIKLAVSTLPGSGPPLCITGPSSNTSSLTQARLRECTAQTNPARWNQLWSWEDGARWKGENEAISDYGQFCLRSDNTNPTGRKLHTGSCANKQDWGSFNPDPAVGAGAAGPTTYQVVNFLEFGRCFDVTTEAVDYTHMIIYPCKQDPSGGSKLKWNHKWYYSEPAAGAASVETTIMVRFNNIDNAANRYCLENKGTAYPKLEKCNAAKAAQQWIRYGDTGNYQTSYTFVPRSATSKCIGIAEKFENAWSKMVLSDCTGGLDQKWNAPPEKVSASVGNYLESRGG